MASTNEAAIRAQVAHNIANVWSLEQYLTFLNQDGGNLHADIAMWAEDGVTTAQQLADYLDGANARNVEKSERF